MNKNYQQCLENAKTPTAQLIEMYSNKYHETDIIKYERIAQTKLRDNFKLDTYDSIWITVATINQMYSTNIYRVHDMVKHIFDNKAEINDKIEKGDYSVVKLIAEVELGEEGKRKKYNMYSFATKFCSHFNPYKFPIYDSYVEIMLTWYNEEYRKQDGSVTKLKTEDFKDYARFVEIVETFSNRYNLKKDNGEPFSIKEIDEFLWLYGKELLKQAKEEEWQKSKKK